MTPSKSRGVHLDEYLNALKSGAVPAGITLGVAVASGFGLTKLIGADDRLAVIFGAVIFLILQSFALYNVVSAIGDEVRDVLNVRNRCTLVSAPSHAKMIQVDGGTWSSDGVMWLGLLSDPGAALKVSISLPKDVDLTMKHLEVMTHRWTRLGPGPDGSVRFEADVSSESSLTTLAQFSLNAQECDPNGPAIIVNTAGSGTSGVHLNHQIEIGLLPSVRDDIEMKDISAS